MLRKIISVIFVVVMLAACNGQPPIPTVTLAPTQAPTNTPLPAPTATVEKEEVNTASNATLLPSATPSPAPVVIDIGPDNFPADVNPLTGLVVTDTTLLERRPVAIKVNIVPRGYTRPPWGL